MSEEDIITMIREWMAELDLSVSELARRLGISRHTLTNYLNRGRSMPVWLLIDIMQELGGKVEVGPWSG